jgi:threonine/homoserine/homoserine lactone efflux protein
MGLLLMAMGSFAFVGAITPGPVNVLALRHGAAANRGATLAYVLGASLSYASVVWLMGLGGELLLSNPLLVQVVRWIGAAYMFYLAWRIATSPVAELNGKAPSTCNSGLETLVEGALTQSLNPKAWVVALSGVSLFVLPQENVPQARWFYVAVSLLACFVGVGSWAWVGRVLAQWLTLPARQKAFNRTMGTVLALCVLAMLG